MEATTQDSQYQRLRELIYDEDKIVTTTLLATELKTSNCNAQHLLNAFVNDTNKSKSNGVYLTFVICGKLQNSEGVAIYLVEQNKLKEKRALFDTISSEIVYSVQKGNHIDFNMIAITNSVNENGSGPLVSKNCVKRRIKSRKHLTQSSAVATTVATTSSKTVKEINTEKSQNIQENKKDQQSQKQSKPKQGGIVSFFAKAASKPLQNGVKPANKDEIGSKEKVSANVEQDNIIKKEEPSNTEKIASDQKMDIDNHEDTKTIKDQNNSKKRKKDSKNKGPNKKRKRIQEICDSDSSDIFENDENEDIIDMSEDEPAPTPAPNPVSVPVPKNKRRKAVDKTYVDEEGFIVTTTEYIYETASEDEEKSSPKQKSEGKIELQKKNENLRLETKPAGNKGKLTKKHTNGKQPTLMSFFKKN